MNSEEEPTKEADTESAVLTIPYSGLNTLLKMLLPSGCDAGETANNLRLAGQVDYTRMFYDMMGGNGLFSEQWFRRIVVPKDVEGAVERVREQYQDGGVLLVHTDTEGEVRYLMGGRRYSIDMMQVMLNSKVEMEDGSEHSSPDLVHSIRLYYMYSPSCEDAAGCLREASAYGYEKFEKPAVSVDSVEDSEGLEYAFNIVLTGHGADGVSQLGKLVAAVSSGAFGIGASAWRRPSDGNDNIEENDNETEDKDKA